MNSYPNQEFQTRDGRLNRIERALEEKARVGHADETRYGFAAQVANATPPVNEQFRRTLRARLLAQGIQNERHAARERNAVQPLFLRRFALVAVTVVLAATLALTLTDVVEWDGLLTGRAGSEGRIAAEDFDALAASIDRDPAPRTVITYPGRASPISKRVKYETVSLSIGEDATPATIQGAVDAILPADGYVDLVMPAVHESDTAHQVRAVVERALYHVYEPSGRMATEAYGALERNTYLVGPEDATLGPIGERFEGGVELVAGGVLDEPQAGMPLRVALDWRAREPLSESLVVFVHLQRGEFELVAQRDAVPGNGLFPVAEWGPGELVRDQFALLLPPDLPAGEYEVRVGIYDATTQRRYSLAEPGQGTYVVLENWILASSTLGEQS